ncbi:substrate-binding domain-containing protein [Microbacterium gilvum]|uniref:Substrate-binding domain-containing protein n=1 Tax=Microbacterium gilvum TaxID=1336204 RepID=A0ABP8ZYJ6_9MICO
MTDTTAPRRLPRARHEHILRELELRGSVRAAAVAEQLGVTEVTIRRDIIDLEKAGRLARVHGGAISLAAAPRPQPARSLAGLVLPTSTGSHYPDFVRGAEAASPALRARVVLASSHYRGAAERKHVERLIELGVEGLMIAPTLRDQTVDDIAASLQDVTVPVVLVERRLDDSTRLAQYDWIRTDHARGAMLAVEHLARLGHASVGLALLDRTPTAPSIREGHARAVEHLRLAPAPLQPLPKDEGEPDLADAALEAFLDDCLANGTRAVLVHTDYHASRLVEIAVDRGVRVPEDLAIVAYDDENAELAIVPLTAVSPPGRELGRLALQTLFERVRSDDPAAIPPRHVQLVPRLTIRRSCGAPATVSRSA